VVAEAMGAIENALLDAKAKRLGVPCYELLGGKQRDRIRLYWSHCAKAIVRVDEDRFLECSLAYFVIADPGQKLVAAVRLDDFEAQVFHWLIQHCVWSSPQVAPAQGLGLRQRR
jgi:L-alanine-DL-glutamate epimerase-like enolase superfamily enzyme